MNSETAMSALSLHETELLEENPSLKLYLEEALQKAYAKGVLFAVKETELPSGTFPVECPYSLTEILGDRFYPDEASELIEELE